MARLEDIDPVGRRRLEELDCPVFETTPWVAPDRPLARRRIALVSTAGLQVAGDHPFGVGDGGFRVIPRDAGGRLAMSHVSSNFDRSGFYDDVNVMLPLDRMAELAAEGTIGGVADRHYSVMGATAPEAMQPFAQDAAAAMRAEGVDTVLLVPV